jgi:hypothetical protein
MMNEMKSLADKLRSTITVPAMEPVVQEVTQPKVQTQPDPDILTQIKAYDTKDHKTMVHARFDAKTAQMLNHFKMATGVENTKIAAFAIKFLFQQHPELKAIVKTYIQNLEL